ncbi:MAG: MarR family transcriptional regulator [Pseudonocardiaceae bacterium]|nr:MarR family transcriptional regulator [Pseudonocardiaceae bacterium]
MLPLRMLRIYYRRMRSEAPPLLPILRSRTQAGILATLLLNPGLELTQTELARRVDASVTSVSDEVRRLVQAGILASRTLGRARLIRAGQGPLVDALAEVVLRAFGPVQIVGEEFAMARAQLGGVIERVALFGSWAARYQGEPGHDPGDIDVLVVVTDVGVDRETIYAAADRSQRRLGRPVNPTVVTTTRWAGRGSGTDQLLDEITVRTLVPVALPTEPGTKGEA